MVSSDLAILNRLFRSQAIFPLNWISEKFELSLKQDRSQVRVGVHEVTIFSRGSEQNSLRTLIM